jgi:hypothetical protein
MDEEGELRRDLDRKVLAIDEFEPPFALLIATQISLDRSQGFPHHPSVVPWLGYYKKSTQVRLLQRNATPPNLTAMGCGASSATKEPPHPAVDDDWPLKAEAIRVFKLADLDGNGHLDVDEIGNTLKKPQFAETAMKNLDLNADGKVSQREWLIAMHQTYEKSEAACRTSLKATEKAIMHNRENAAE